MLNQDVQTDLPTENAGKTVGKKYTLIIGALSLLLIIILLLIIFLPRLIRNNNILTSELSPTPSSLPLPSPIISPIIPTSPPTPVPQPGDIIIDGIAVNNFKKNAVRITENGNTILDENTQYEIIFNEAEQKLILVLRGENFENSQSSAESRLLELLGIDELNVCRLFVEEQIPTSVNNEYAGQVFPLSYCEDV